jgi:hypothetical protein
MMQSRSGLIQPVNLKDIDIKEVIGSLPANTRTPAILAYSQHDDVVEQSSGLQFLRLILAWTAVDVASQLFPVFRRRSRLALARMIGEYVASQQTAHLRAQRIPTSNHTSLNLQSFHPWRITADYFGDDADLAPLVQRYLSRIP